MDLRWLSGGAILLASSACNILAGFPDYTFGDEPPGSNAGPGGGSAGGAGAGGGAGGSGDAGGTGGEGPDCLVASDCTAPYLCREERCVTLARWATALPHDELESVAALAVGADGHTAVVTKAPLNDTARLLRFASDGSTATDQIVSSTGVAHLSAVVVDDSGDTLAVGLVAGTAQIEGGSATATNDYDVLALRWMQGNALGCMTAFGGNDSQSAAAIAFGSSGTFVAGSFSGAIDLGSGPTTGPGAQALWVANLNAPGSCSTSATPLTLGSDGYDRLEALTIATDGSPVLVASFGQNGVAGSTSVSAGHAVIKLAPSLTSVDWAVPLGEPSSPDLQIDATPDGGVVVLASFDGALTIAGLTLQAPPGGRLTALLKLAENGDLEWNEATTGDGISNGHDLAVGNDGTILVVGVAAGTVDFGGGALTAHDSVGMPTYFDMFVWSLNATGAHRYSQIFPAPGDQWALAVDYDPVSQGFVLAGDFEGTLDVGARGTVTSDDGSMDTFVVAIEP